MRSKEGLFVTGLLIGLVIWLSGCGEEPTPCPACPTSVPTSVPCPTETAIPEATATPEATPTAIPTPSPTPVIILWDGRLTQLGVSIEENGKHDLVAAWITVNGDWASAPDWAKNKYPWANLGCDHCTYGLFYNEDGTINNQAGFVLWWPDGANQTTADTSSHPYWANFPIYAGYDWSVVSGPYDWYKYDGDKLKGVGLPYPPLPWQEVAVMGGVHLSFFGVWEEGEEE